jgi:hypothetical protein
MTGLLATLAFAALFVAFGLLRPADRSGGCHGCTDQSAGRCGAACPLSRDPSPDDTHSGSSQ